MVALLFGESMTKKISLMLVILTAYTGIVYAANKISVVAETGQFIEVLTTPINDGSSLYSVWNGATNSLYIVSPDGAYTNLLMTTAGE